MKRFIKSIKAMFAILGVVLVGCATMTPTGAQPELANKPLSPDMMKVIDTGAINESDVREFLKTGTVQKRFTREGVVAGIIAGGLMIGTGSPGVLGADAAISARELTKGVGLGQFIFIIPADQIAAAYARGDKPERMKAFPDLKSVIGAAATVKGADGKSYYLFDHVLPFAKVGEHSPQAELNLTHDIPGSISWSGIGSYPVTGKFATECRYTIAVMRVDGREITPNEFSKCVKYVPPAATH